MRVRDWQCLSTSSAEDVRRPARGRAALEALPQYWLTTLAAQDWRGEKGLFSGEVEGTTLRSQSWRQMAPEELKPLGELPLAAWQPQRPSLFRRIWHFCLALWQLIKVACYFILKSIFSPSNAWLQRLGVDSQRLSPELVGWTAVAPSGDPTARLNVFTAQRSIYQSMRCPGVALLAEEAYALGQQSRDYETLAGLCNAFYFTTRNYGAFLDSIEALLARRAAEVRTQLAAGQAATLFYRNRERFDLILFLPEEGGRVGVQSLTLYEGRGIYRADLGSTSTEELSTAIYDAQYCAPLKRALREYGSVDCCYPLLYAVEEQMRQHRMGVAPPTGSPIVTCDFAPAGYLVEEVVRLKHPKAEVWATDPNLFAAQKRLATVSVASASLWALSPLFSLFSRLFPEGKLVLGVTVNELERLADEAASIAGLFAPQHPWAPALAELRAALLGAPSVQPLPVSLHSAVEKCSSKGGLEGAVLRRDLRLRAQAQPCHTLEEVRGILTAAVRDTQASAASELERRGEFLARCMGLNLEGLGLEIPYPERDITHNDQLASLYPLLQEVRAELGPYCQKTSAIALDPQEWWTVQKLSMLVGSVAEARAFALLKEPCFLDLLERSADLIQQNPYGDVLIGITPFKKDWLDGRPAGTEVPRYTLLQNHSLAERLDEALKLCTAVTALQCSHEEQDAVIEEVQQQLGRLEEVFGCAKDVELTIQMVEELSPLEQHSAFDLQPEQYTTIRHWQSWVSRLDRLEMPMNRYWAFLSLLSNGPSVLSKMGQGLEKSESYTSFALPWRVSLEYSLYEDLTEDLTHKIAWLLRHLLEEHVRPQAELWLALSFSGHNTKSFDRDSFGLKRRVEEQVREDTRLCQYFVKVGADVLGKSWLPHFAEMGAALSATPYVETWRKDQAIACDGGFSKNSSGILCRRKFTAWCCAVRSKLRESEPGSDYLQLALAIDPRMKVEERYAGVATILHNATLEGADPLGNPQLAGLYIRLSACPHNLLLTGVQAHALTQALIALSSGLPLRLLRNEAEALRWLAWIARALVHLPAECVEQVVPELCRAHPALENQSVWMLLLERREGFARQKLHDLLRAAMWLDHRTTGSEPSWLEQMSPSQEVTQALRLALLKEGSHLTRQPTNGAEAEWIRDAGAYYVERWLPSLIQELEEGERAALEEAWARSLLGLRPADSLQRIPEEEGGSRFVVQGFTHRLCGPSEAWVDLQRGRGVLLGSYEVGWHHDYAPYDAYEQIPCLAEFCGKREVFPYYVDEMGNGRLRIFGKSGDAQWLDLVDSPQGLTMEGYFKDPLGPERSPSEKWLWQVPFRGSRKDSSHYAVLERYGCWASLDGSRKRLCVGNPLASSRQNSYRLTPDPSSPDRILYIQGKELYLLPHRQEQHGSSPVLKLLAAHQDAHIEGTKQGKITRVRFPSLEDMEWELLPPPSWLPTHQKVWHMRWHGTLYVECPTLQHRAATLFGASFSEYTLPSMKEDGQAVLWVMPEAGGAGSVQPVLLPLTSADPELATVASSDLLALGECFCSVMAWHVPRPSLLLYLAVLLSRQDAAALSEEEKNTLCHRLRDALDQCPDPSLSVVLDLRLQLMQQRWGTEDTGHSPAHSLESWREQLVEWATQALRQERPKCLLRDMLFSSGELEILSSSMGEREREELIDTVHQYQKALFYTPLSAPLPHTPLLLTSTDLHLEVGTLEKPPILPALQVGTNSKALQELFARQDNPIYQHSLQQLQASLESPPDAEGCADLLLVQELRRRQPLWQVHHLTLCQQEKEQRQWILSALQHITEQPALSHFAMDYLWGDCTRATEALHEVMQLWASGTLDHSTRPMGLAGEVERMMCTICQRQMLERLLHLLNSREWDLTQIRAQLAQAEDLSRTLSGQDCRPLHRERLFLQVNRGVLLREEQMQAVRQILQPGHVALQLRPGFGKTDLLLPLTLRVACAEKKNTTVLVPEHLVVMTHQSLVRGCLCPVRAQFERHTLQDKAQIDSWVERLRRARAHCLPVITTAESLALVDVTLAEIWADLISMSEEGLHSGKVERKQVQAHQTKRNVLIELRTLLRQGSYVVDEVDTVCAPHRKLIFATGSPLEHPEEALQWATNFFERLSRPSEFRDTEAVRTLKQSFRDKTTASLLLQDRRLVQEGILEIARTSLQGLCTEREQEKILADRPLLEESAALQKLGTFVRQMVGQSIPHVFLGAFGHEYGWGAERHVGVPYTEGEEQKDTQFSYFADQVAFTLASGSFSIPMDAKVLARCMSEALPRLRGVMTRDGKQDLAELLEALHKRAEEENLQQEDRKQQSIPEILQRILQEESYRELRLELVHFALLPELVTFTGSIHRRMSDLLEGIDEVKGLTGTLRPLQLPPPLFSACTALEQQERCSSVEVHAALLQGGAPPLLLGPLQDDVSALAAIVTLIQDFDVMLNQAGIGHSGEGSTLVAQEIVRETGHPVAFYTQERGNRLLEKVGGVLSEKALTGPAPPGTKFYLGPHDLRGVNLPMPVNARAVYLPCSTVLDDSLEQAIRRLRKLGCQQTVSLCLPYGIEESLRRRGGALSTAAFLQDVLRRSYADEGRMEEMQKHNVSLAAQHRLDNAKWMSPNGRVSERSLQDVWERDRPLVPEQPWGLANWRAHEEESTGVECQMIHAQERRVVQEVEHQVEVAKVVRGGVSMPDVWQGYDGLAGAGYQIDVVKDEEGPHLQAPTWKALQTQKCRPAASFLVAQDPRAKAFLALPSNAVSYTSPVLGDVLLFGSSREQQNQVDRCREKKYDYAMIYPLVQDAKGPIQFDWIVAASSTPNFADLVYQQLKAKRFDQLESILSATLSEGFQPAIRARLAEEQPELHAEVDLPSQEELCGSSSSTATAGIQQRSFVRA